MPQVLQYHNSHLLRGIACNSQAYSDSLVFLALRMIHRCPLSLSAEDPEHSKTALQWAQVPTAMRAERSKTSSSSPPRTSPQPPSQPSSSYPSPPSTTRSTAPTTPSASSSASQSLPTTMRSWENRAKQTILMVNIWQ